MVVCLRSFRRRTRWSDADHGRTPSRRINRRTDALARPPRTLEARIDCASATSRLRGRTDWVLNVSFATSNIRGACPTVAAPMQTGDGLLARIISTEPISVDELCTLCDASLAHGNGIIEITQRGSLQIRGLSA